MLCNVVFIDSKIVLNPSEMDVGKLLIESDIVCSVFFIELSTSSKLSNIKLGSDIILCQTVLRLSARPDSLPHKVLESSSLQLPPGVDVAPPLPVSPSPVPGVEPEEEKLYLHYHYK
jgi:hypothetical protein